MLLSTKQLQAVLMHCITAPSFEEMQARMKATVVELTETEHLSLVLRVQAPSLEEFGGGSLSGIQAELSLLEDDLKSIKESSNGSG